MVEVLGSGSDSDGEEARCRMPVSFDRSLRFPSRVAVVVVVDKGDRGIYDSDGFVEKRVCVRIN